MIIIVIAGLGWGLRFGKNTQPNSRNKNKIAVMKKQQIITF
jgi:hypothetical protein